MEGALDRRVSVSFFWVRQKRGTTTPFSSVLHRVNTIPLADRTREVKDTTLRLEQLTGMPSSTLFFAEMVRIQTDNKPGMASVTTPRRALTLPDEDHGLAHSVIFAYDPHTSVLAMQSARVGITTSKVAGYLRLISGGDMYAFEPILKPDALARLDTISAHKVRIKIAAPEDLTVVDDEQRTVRDSIQGLKDLAGGPWVDVAITVGRQEEELNTGAVRRFLSWLSGEAAESRGKIARLQVEGSAEVDDEKIEMAIDLLSEHLKVEAELTFPDNDPQGSYLVRATFIRDAFVQNATYLEAYAK